MGLGFGFGVFCVCAGMSAFETGKLVGRGREKVGIMRIYSVLD